jgi:hypothetical protein
VVKDIGFKDVQKGLQGKAISDAIRAKRVRKLKEIL